MIYKTQIKKLTASIAVAVGAQAALIPAAAALEIEEVVVTARKRAESLQEVPITVSAFSDEMIKNLGVAEAGDIALFTPNFTWHTEFGRATPQPYLRGIGTNNFMPINNGPIAIYQDNVFIGPNPAQGFATFDLERVEVLKGPQGTLYGRNSTGGLVNFISKKPEIGGGHQGFLTAEVGSFNTTNLEGAYGFDISDTAAGRIAFTRNLNQGAVDNKNPASDDDKTGSIDDYAVRAQFLFEPNADLSLLLNTHYGRANPDTAPFKNIGVGDLTDPQPDGYGGIYFPSPCPNPGLGNPNCGEVYTGFIDDPDLHTTTKQDDFEDVETMGAFVQIEYAINENLSLTSLTAYDQAEMKRLDDVDDAIINYEVDHYYADFDFWSQELRLSGTSDSAKWHLGLYYYSEEAQQITSFDLPIFFTGIGNRIDIDTETYAVFGQYDFDVTDKLSLGVGLRWTYEEKDVTQFDGFNTALDGGMITSIYDSDSDIPVGATGFVPGTTGAEDTDEITGRLSASYQVSDDAMVYASLSRGFKGGDIGGATTLPFFDATRAATPVEQAQFAAQTQLVEPEILDAAEIGFKSDWLDGNLRVNGALFYYIYKDQQQTILTEDPTGALPFLTTLENAGRSEMPGAELEIIYTPTDNWYIQANAGYVDAEYEEFVRGAGEDFSGHQISLTPKQQFSALVRYDWPLASGAVIAIQTDLAYQSSTFFQPQNDATLVGSVLQEGGYTVWGGRVSYTSADAKWNVALYGKNLGDKEFLVSGFEVPNYAAAKPGAERYLGFTLTYNFGE